MAPRLSRVRPLAVGAAVVALTLTTLAASQAPKPKPQDPATQKPAGQSGQAAPAPDGQAQGDQAAQPTFRANINLVRVDVIDGGKRTKAVRPRSQTPPSGLQYVELLSDRWSSGATDSFRVWFEIDTQTSGLIGRKQPPPA